jgi:hypothetical protein
LRQKKWADRFWFGLGAQDFVNPNQLGTGKIDLTALNFVEEINQAVDATAVHGGCIDTQDEDWIILPAPMSGDIT